MSTQVLSEFDAPCGTQRTNTINDPNKNMATPLEKEQVRPISTTNLIHCTKDQLIVLGARKATCSMRKSPITSPLGEPGRCKSMTTL